MYEHIAPSYNALHGPEQERKLRRFLLRLDLRPGMRVADIGCGTAHLARFFDEQEYVGIDPCVPLLKQAPDGIEVVEAFGEDVPLEDSSQDLVISLTSLHNYNDPVAGIEELARIAKDVVIVGVLKKAHAHDLLVQTVRDHLRVEDVLQDRHDTLLLCHKR